MSKFLSYSKKAFHGLTLASALLAAYGGPVSSISPKAAAGVAAASAGVSLALHLLTTFFPAAADPAK